MRLKSNQEQLDSFIYKRINDKEGLKEKAIRKNRQLLNPKFLVETYKEKMERRLRSKDQPSATTAGSIEERRDDK
jgi:hypothetical protein